MNNIDNPNCKKFVVACHDKYTSKATFLNHSDDLTEAKEMGISLRRVYRHVTVHDKETGKIVLQRKDRDCCKVVTVEFK